ncbi:hypothetical protein FRAAL5739 [Frankia alni ACN14a]|uniref:Uncharacterized protein n=1 Tax=Frankia alni (strain DSM 45986 / CECT 9034 / ACN14a) TaxID=326424 RepID=Q0RDU5_FRAAA|nr:hypothetical protein FRAAL5739 [Frankia alni ACN14a]
MALGPLRSGGLRSLVRLGRRDLWFRLDRNMLGAGSRGSMPGLGSPGRAPGGSVRTH